MAFDYKEYWEQLYAQGGNSGSGSYGILGQFKARVVNDFIGQHEVRSVMEFGCGDGHQLQYMRYPKYLGVDIAASSVLRCMARYREDQTKSFLWYRPGLFANRGYLQADLVVCLDVLYHIIDETDYVNTLQDIYACSRRYIILYTKITPGDTPQTVMTIKDRDIFHYLNQFPSLTVLDTVEQPYPGLSSSSFILLCKSG